MTIDLDAMERRANAWVHAHRHRASSPPPCIPVAPHELIALIARVRELEESRTRAIGECSKAKASAEARGRQEGVAAERKRCVEIARMFADENILMAGDTILMDPILSRARRKELGPVTAEECALSEKMQIEGCVHSAMYHAAKNIANAIERKAGSDTGTEK